MVSEISEISSSVVTKGGQICSVLLWIVRISKPASVHSSATRLTGDVRAQLHAGHECVPRPDVGHEVVGAQWLDSGLRPCLGRSQ
jgi:hypothetical protein